MKGFNLPCTSYSDILCQHCDGIAGDYTLLLIILKVVMFNKYEIFHFMQQIISVFQNIYGVSIHPKYGGWFALRGVLIFKNVQCPDLQKKQAIDIVSTQELKQDLLERFNFHWQDWTFRDIIPVEKKYSELQKQYFATPPKDRRALIDKCKTENV